MAKINTPEVFVSVVNGPHVIMSEPELYATTVRGPHVVMSEPELYATTVRGPHVIMSEPELYATTVRGPHVIMSEPELYVSMTPKYRLNLNADTSIIDRVIDPKDTYGTMTTYVLDFGEEFTFDMFLEFDGIKNVFGSYRFANDDGAFCDYVDWFPDDNTVRISCRYLQLQVYTQYKATKAILHLMRPVISDDDVILYLHSRNKEIVEETNHTWTLNGNPVASGDGIYLDKSSYMALNEPITIGGRDFTIDFWVNFTSQSGNYSRIFNAFNFLSSNNQFLAFYDIKTNNNIGFCVSNSEISGGKFRDAFHHVAIVYKQETNIVTMFIDGKIVATKSVAIPEIEYKNLWINKSNYNTDPNGVQTINDFRITNRALWTEEFDINELRYMIPLK